MDDKVRELLEKAKLTAAAAAGVASQAVGTAAEKGGRLVEKTRRSLKLLNLNNEIEILMREIGRIVYLTHTGTETEESALQEKLERIDAKYAEIAGLKAEQEAQRTKVVCPVCGKECDKTDLYCRVCGEKLS